MAREVTIPALGVAMEEALLISWFKQEGDAVEADEPIAEIETDKTTLELVAPAAGWLGPHQFPAGATVPVGAAVALVYADQAEAASSAAAQPAVETVEPVTRPAAAAERASADGDERRPHRLSPRARRAAAVADKPACRFREL